MPRSTKVSPRNDPPSAPAEGGWAANFIPPTEAQLREIAADLVPQLYTGKPLRPPIHRIEEVICDVCGGAATGPDFVDWQHQLGRHHREALRRIVTEGRGNGHDAETLSVLDAEAKAQGVD